MRVTGDKLFCARQAVDEVINKHRASPVHSFVFLAEVSRGVGIPMKPPTDPT